MIGFGMPYVPSLEEKYEDLCDHDTCYLVLCSAAPPKKIRLVGIRLNYDGLSMGIRIVYHRQEYNQISKCDRLANNILATVNRRVTNPQIQLTENPMLVEITPGQTRFTMTGVLYKVSSVIDEHNEGAVAIHPSASRGQDLPTNISVDVVRAAIVDSLSANAVRRALGPSRVLGQLSNIMPP
jgi:hypothetical protein